MQRKVSTLLHSGSPQDNTSMHQASLEHAWCVCTIQLEGVVHGYLRMQAFSTACLDCVGGAACLIPTSIVSVYKMASGIGKTATGSSTDLPKRRGEAGGGDPKKPAVKLSDFKSLNRLLGIVSFLFNSLSWGCRN